MHGNLCPVRIEGSIGTGIHAVMALVRSYAAVVVHSQFRMLQLRLGIAAPLAAQMATFQKGYRPDAGSVMDGIFLDIKYQACGLLVFHSAHTVSLRTSFHALRACPLFFQGGNRPLSSVFCPGRPGGLPGSYSWKWQPAYGFPLDALMHGTGNEVILQVR